MALTGFFYPAVIDKPRMLVTIHFCALNESRGVYNAFITAERRADKCAVCGECEAKCPQNIKIAEILAEAHKMLQESRRILC